MSDHETQDIVPMLIQAFEAFNRSADKLSIAYRCRFADCEEGDSPCHPVSSHPCPSIEPILTAIGDVIIYVADKMRSPLSAIQLFAEVLKQDLSESKEVETQHALSVLDDILLGVHSLNAVLSNLLSFAQPVSPHYQEVDLVAVLDESLLFAASAMEQQNISLVKKYSHGRLYCNGDVEQLKQVCFNLILNAIQAMPQGGDLCVRAWYSGDGDNPPYPWKNTESINVEIEDSGCGIPDESMDRIFTPFFTTKEGGAGLGLCIVYRVVQAHQGSTQIRSICGHGTTVSIQLPVIKVSQSA